MWPFRKKRDKLDDVIELLQDQNIAMLGIVNRLDVLASYKSATDQNMLRVLESLSASAPAMQGRSMIEMENRLMDIIDLMRSEPFAALKTWIDQSTTAGKKIGDMMQAARDVERQMLARWEAQVRDLKEQIFLLLHAQPGRETIVPLKPPQPLDFGKGVIDHSYEAWRASVNRATRVAVNEVKDDAGATGGDGVPVVPAETANSGE